MFPTSFPTSFGTTTTGLGLFYNQYGNYETDLICYGIPNSGQILNTGLSINVVSYTQNICSIANFSYNSTTLGNSTSFINFDTTSGNMVTITCGPTGPTGPDLNLSASSVNISNQLSFTNNNSGILMNNTGPNNSQANYLYFPTAATSLGGWTGPYGLGLSYGLDYTNYINFCGYGNGYSIYLQGGNETTPLLIMNRDNTYKPYINTSGFFTSASQTAPTSTTNLNSTYGTFYNTGGTPYFAYNNNGTITNYSLVTSTSLSNYASLAGSNNFTGTNTFNNITINSNSGINFNTNIAKLTFPSNFPTSPLTNNETGIGLFWNDNNNGTGETDIICYGQGGPGGLSIWGGPSYSGNPTSDPITNPNTTPVNRIADLWTTHITFYQDVSFNESVTVPTPSSGDNSTNVATTAFVQSNYASLTGSNTFTGTNTFNNQVTAISFNTTSDYRIKENVIELNESYSVENLRPVEYDNLLINKKSLGFIAHEVQEQYPFLVTGEKDGKENQSINYQEIIPILVKEIQDLKKRVTLLEN